MTGAVKPAACATSVNLAWNGRPDGLPGVAGRVLRVAMPWPCNRAKGRASHLAKLRRVHIRMNFQTNIALPAIERDERWQVLLLRPNPRPIETERHECVRMRVVFRRTV